MKQSAVCATVSSRPRAVSQMSAKSFMHCSMSKNCVSVDHSLVFRLATRSRLAPQLGWHEQARLPKFGPSGPCSDRR